MEKRLLGCNLCGSKQFSVLFPDELGDNAPPVNYDFSPETRKTFQIVKCNCCNLVYTNPMPCLGVAYTESCDEVYLASESQRVFTAQKLIAKILQFEKTGALLDVGCATGIFLDVASKHFAVEGLELSKWAGQRASRNHKVHRVPLSELKASGKFDVVTLLGVIEHFEDPIAEMARVNGLLKPDGLVVVYTGDLSAWLPRLLGKKWWWFQGMYLYYFSRHTLSRLLEQCGFTVVGTGTHTVYFQLFSLLTSLRRYRFASVVAPILEAGPIRDLMIPLRISGEMLMFARKAKQLEG